MGRERNNQGRYSDGIPPEAVLEVFDERDDRARPLTASDVVDELGIARRTAHNKLNRLVERDVLATRKVGARGRVWWVPDPVDADAPGEHARDGDASAGDGGPGDTTPDQSAPSDSDSRPLSEDALEDVLATVADGWDDSPDRLEARKAAARAVLTHAATTGDAIGKSDALEGFYSEHAVDGQNKETWWRKNIRPVLRAAGDYSNADHGYTVDLEDGDDGEA